MTIQSLFSTGIAPVSGGGSGSSSWGTSGASSSPAASSSQGAVRTQLSPGARLLSELQKLEQQDPSQFQQVTSALAGSLQGQAQKAQQSGNTTEASQLNQLASAFSTASKTGDLTALQSTVQQQSSADSGTDSDGDTDGSGGGSSTNPNVLAYRQNASGYSGGENLWSQFQAAGGG